MKAKEPERNNSLFNPDLDATDMGYIKIRDNLKYGRQKDFCNELYSQFCCYADRDFKKEITRQFHQRWWEMYLACTFLKKSFKIVPRSERPKDGPDILIRDDDGNLWIEAVAPERGTGQDAVPEINSLPESFLMPEKEIILRYSKAIKGKHEKYQNYRRKEIVKDEDRCVIAINGGNVPCAFLADGEDEAPLPIKVVFPCGDPQVDVDSETFFIKRSYYGFRPHIIRKNEKPESTMIFLDKEYAGISALLFSTVNVVSSASVPGDDFIIIHNPLARNKIKLGYINMGKEYWINEKGILTKRGCQG